MEARTTEASAFWYGLFSVPGRPEPRRLRVGLAIAVALLASSVSAAGCSPLPRPTRDCGSISVGLCEAAHAEAVKHGLFLQAGQEVASWRVRSTSAQACAGGETPVADVTFELRSPTASVVVTIGQPANSNALTVCSY